MQRALLVGMGLVLVGGVVTPVATPVEVAPASAAVTSAAMPYDFDGDGYADLTVGVIKEDLRGKHNAGAVQVLYGSTSGPTAHDQLWHQGRKGVKGALEKGDKLGWSLASGDFDRDGFADLAIGIPREDVGAKKDSGAVQVLYGSPAGLTATGDQVWHQGTKGVPGRSGEADGFGEQLAVGDFDGDGYADLVVSVAGEDAGEKHNAGRVVMLRGSATGLTSVGAQSWGEGSAGIASKPRSNEMFGYRLAAGDVNGDGHGDLTIAARTRSAGGPTVHLLLGSPSGLTASGSQHFRLADLGFRWASIDSLWLGDVNADGRDDLTVSGSREVGVLHGHADGLHPGPLAAPGQPGTDAIWSTEWSPLAGSAATGDLTGDGHADLAMTRGPDDQMGIVIGTGQGLGSEVTQWPVSGVALNVLPLSGGTHMWLALGDHITPVGSSWYAGKVTVLQATPAGAPGPATVWHQDTPGIKGVVEYGDMFGFAVGGPALG